VGPGRPGEGQGGGRGRRQRRQQQQLRRDQAGQRRTHRQARGPRSSEQPCECLRRFGGGGGVRSPSWGGRCGFGVFSTGATRWVPDLRPCLPNPIPGTPAELCLSSPPPGRLGHRFVPQKLPPPGLLRRVLPPFLPLQGLGGRAPGLSGGPGRRAGQGASLGLCLTPSWSSRRPIHGRG
jgi:hypothetical protein